jgi:drug/metabolite transporter (DMT)-like permease
MFSLLTVGCWGLYGAFLHTGQVSMADPVNGRYKAFLCVGLAYFLTAVVAPFAMLVIKGASWSFTAKGVGWSILAGIVGAVGAFGVLLAFGAKGTPAVVMSIVFAGAPVLNAIYSLLLHPPADDEPIRLVDLEREGVGRFETAERDRARHLGEEVVAHVPSSSPSRRRFV